MHTDKAYRFESLLDGDALSDSQRMLVSRNTENQACDPCDCNEGDCNCNCN